MKVNAKKTEMMVSTREIRVEADTSDKKKYKLKQVETFKYLGSMINKNDGYYEEVIHRVGAAEISRM